MYQDTWRREVKAMSKYTTGDIAKLCGVTVRTVQYYDSRGILVPVNCRKAEEGSIQKMI